MKKLEKFLGKYHVPQALAATVAAWLAAVVTLTIVGIFTGGDLEGRPSLSDVLSGLPFVGVFVGIVVFPSCLVLVYPVYLFLPRNHSMWRPWSASAVGAVVGPAVMYGWGAVSQWRLFWIGFGAAVFMGVPAMVAGMVFGFCFTKLVARKDAKAALG